MDKKSLIKQWPVLFVVLFIPAILIATGVIGGNDSQKSDSATQMREGAIEESSLDSATASLKRAIEAAGGAQYNFSAQPTFGRYANFGIVQQLDEVRSVGLVDEMAINFSGATNNEYAEVDPKTNQVVSFHRETDYSDDTKTNAELEEMVRAFLSEVYPNFAQVEEALAFENNSKSGRSESRNYFFTWNDMNFANELPEGAETERPPFIQVGITSTGYIFSYNNTIDIYRNALEEFSLTQ
jgi:hypothetical protein